MKPSSPLLSKGRGGCTAKVVGVEVISQKCL